LIENKKLTTTELVDYLGSFQGQTLTIKEMMGDLQIKEEQQRAFRMMLSRLCADGTKGIKIKTIGSKSGLYKILTNITPINTLVIPNSKPIDITFPYGIDDVSGFGFEQILEVDEGDVLVIAGDSNSAKTAWVINMLAANMDKFPCVLMGNEYARIDNQLSPKFVRRMKRMDWVNWENEAGQLKFIILPVNEDYEDWVQPGKINFIDWIDIEENLWLIGRIIKRIKHAVGNGVAIIVLQKGRGQILGRGRDWGLQMADFYVAIDPLGQYQRRLTVQKAKATKGYLDGRMWGFDIIDFGTKFHNIREIKKCSHCYGKGYTTRGDCEECNKTGYVDV